MDDGSDADTVMIPCDKLYKDKLYKVYKGMDSMYELHAFVHAFFYIRI